MKHILTLFVLFICTSALAQTPPEPRFKTGLMFDDEQYNAVPMQSKFAGSKFNELPLVVSLKKWCPHPGDQGKIGSCVGWSSCYGALSMMYAQRDKITDKNLITANAFSGLYVYNQVKKNDISCDGGTMFPLLLDVLKREGSCHHSEFDVKSCSVQPPEPLKQKARPNAIKDYQALFQTTDETNLKVLKTKQSLAEGKPVVVGVSIKYNFLDLNKTNPVWDPKSGLAFSAGGHAMVVIGYDEGKQAFELLNSWGTKWGNDGYGWIKYEDYGTYCKYGFQLFLNEDGRKVKGETLAGDFIFQYLPKGGGLNFLPAEVERNEDEMYTTARKDWPVGQLFQVIAKNKAKDQYMYVFSIDAKGKANVHFPRNKLNTKNFGFNETPLVSVTNAEIIIPNPESALSIGQAGKDILIVLYAKKEIEDFDEKVSAFELLEDTPVRDQLNTHFNQRFIDPKKVDYYPHTMGFTAVVKDNEIVPILLEVQSVD
ncbi:MAG: C39 family peptidase [Chitinophagaceae bacterium]|nr:C39 family peptidase [Chitinophagaceae bacterium]